MAIIDDIQSQIYERRTSAAWKSINELSGHKLTPLSYVKASSIEQVKEKLRQHYANVLNWPLPPSPFNDDDDVITFSPDLDPSKVTDTITTLFSFFLFFRLILKKLMSSYTGMEECQKNKHHH